jgi:hypothetical protein
VSVDGGESPRIEAERTREQAVDVVDLLNDVLTDIYSAGTLWRGLLRGLREKKINFPGRTLSRVVVFHMVVALYRCDEIMSNYGRVLGTHELERRRELRRQIARRRVKQLRDAYIGHIHSRDSHRPLRASEVDALMKELLGDNIDLFVGWLVDGKDSVMAILASLRDAIMREQGIAADEITDR